MSDPKDIQVGGDHYKSCKIQPIEYIHANGLGYCEGAVVKYITRHKSKGGAEDLKKARHYIDLLLSHEYPEDGIDIHGPVEPVAEISVDGYEHLSVLDSLCKYGAKADPLTREQGDGKWR